MLTPRDILEAEFKTVWRGYAPQEVDDFLGKIVKEYEALQRQNQALQEEIVDLKGRLAEYSRLESTIVDTLTTAKDIAEGNKTLAQREAEAIIKKAQVEAESLYNKVRLQVDRELARLQTLKEEEALFRKKLRAMVDSYLAILEEESPEVVDLEPTKVLPEVVPEEEAAVAVEEDDPTEIEQTREINGLNP
ncbi:MAG: DivIVA domain-containing protein [Limnochordia bacterium]|jgi:cell division initiation protein